MTTRLIALTMAVATAMVLSACSFSIGGEAPEDAAVDLIEGDWSSQFGIPITSVACNAPLDDEVGAEFTCQAASAVGLIDFDVVIDREDHIVATPTNLLLRVQVQAIEDGSVELLNDQAGTSLPPDSIDCGDQPIALGPDAQILCSLNDPSSDDVYDTRITVTDIETLAIDIQVAETPR